MAFHRAAYLKAYLATPRGKASRRAALKKYNASPKGRAYRAAYRQTKKGQLASKKYTSSYRGVLQALVKRSKERHRERWPHIPYLITKPYLIEMWRTQKGLCTLSKIKMTWGQGAVRPTSLSLDRIDNSRGYEVGNVRLICYAVNAFRANGTDAEMIAIARALIAVADQSIK